MLRAKWICRRESQSPGASEKIMHRIYLAVPTTGTGALAEKAKTWKVKPIKGIRQFSPVTSVEGVSIFVFFRNVNALVDHSNKDGPTVYQKRSCVLIWKDLYTRWDLPSGGV